MGLPKLHTIDEIADLTHSPRRSVLYWIYSGRLKSLKVGRRRLVAEEALCRFMGVDEDPKAARGAR